MSSVEEKDKVEGGEAVADDKPADLKPPEDKKKTKKTKKGQCHDTTKPSHRTHRPTSIKTGPCYSLKDKKKR